MLSPSGFVGLLKRVVAGEEVELRRITEAAGAIAPGLSIPRGPKNSAASAAHQFLLEDASSATGVRGYTWNAYDEDFADPLTHATRQEFGRADFDPRPARRRSRRPSAAARKFRGIRRDADASRPPCPSALKNKRISALGGRLAFP